MKAILWIIFTSHGELGQIEIVKQEYSSLIVCQSAGQSVENSLDTFLEGVEVRWVCTPL